MAAMKILIVALACGTAAAVPSWKCALTDCALTSPLAKAGPAHQMLLAVGSAGKDTRQACPFGDDDDPPPTKKEYNKYMKALDKVAAMPIEERRAYALRHKDDYLNEPDEEEKKVGPPRVDVTKPGAEAVNSSTWSELRKANKFDFLIVFYAPWCPHCKRFVLAENAPVHAVSESLDKVHGPKVVTFDMVAHESPISLDSVPTIYLFKRSGEALLFQQDVSNIEALMAFALDKPVPAPKGQALVLKSVKKHTQVPAWKCPLTNCALKSPLAKEGPGFQDGLRFFAVGSNGKDSRQACPFGDDNDPPPTKKEYNKYMNALDKVASMPPDERRAYAWRHRNDYLNEPEEEEKKVGPPRVDVTRPGVEAVNSSTWTELRRANKFDFLITFYAPWCPHCKAFVTSANAPLKALSRSLEKVNGPKAVTFDMIEHTAPFTIDSVPTIYLFKKTGEAIEFEGNPNNAEELMAFALGTPKPKTKALVTKKVTLRPRKVPSWACALKNCALKSSLAKEGPAFADGVRFFALGSNGKDTRQACPFGDDDDESEPSDEEYNKYMTGLAKVGDMTSEERVAYAVAHEEEWLNQDEAEEKIKAPTVDITKPGVEAVNSTTWAELRNANKYNMLVVFYAPWCPHCKAFVEGANAPINAFSESLEKVKGAPKVVKFDVVADTAPLVMDAVPSVYLFKTNGQAISFQGEIKNAPSLLEFALDGTQPTHI